MVTHDRLLRALALAQALAALSAGATSVLLVVLAARRLHTSGGGYGLLLPAVLAALMCYGIGTSSGNVAFSTVIQSHVPSHLRGRVFSGFDLIWQSMRLASLLVGGVLADTAGICAVYYAGAALLAAAALTGLTLAGSHDRPHACAQ